MARKKIDREDVARQSDEAGTEAARTIMEAGSVAPENVGAMIDGAFKDEDDRGVPPPTAADAQREVALSVAARPDELPASAGPDAAAERREEEHAGPETNGEADGKRRAIIALVGTDRTTGERKEIHVGRSKRAVRKWAASAMFLLERCFIDLKLAIIKEEDL